MGRLVLLWLTLNNICPRDMRPVRHLIISDWFTLRLLDWFLGLNGFVDYLTTSKSGDSLAMFKSTFTWT